MGLISGPVGRREGELMLEGEHVINNLDLNKSLFLITGVLALLAAVAGVADPGIYDGVVIVPILPGVFTQDVVVILTALLMILLAARMQSDDYRKMAVIFGILGFFFYAYGIYAIEQIYTVLYPLYLAVLGLSFYALIFGLCSLHRPVVDGLQLTPALRYGAAGYGVFIAVMFNFIWVSQLIPLLRTGDRIEYTYSVYVIDLVFIMPAFVIAALLAVRKHAVGVLGLPALFILGAGILSPLALAEVLKPSRYGMPVDPQELALFGSLALVFLVFAVVYLAALKGPRPSAQ